MPQTFLGSFEGEWLTLTSAAQARVLSDAAALQHLEPFLGRTLGAAEAARAAGVSVEGMLYRIRQFLAAGLLSEVGERPRSGRPIRLYRAPGGVQVPFHLTPFSDLEAQLDKLTRHLDRLRTHALARERTSTGTGGFLYYREAAGRVVFELDGGDEPMGGARGLHVPSDAVMDVVHLNEAQARRAHVLLKELRALSLANHGPSQEGQPYLIQMALVRLQPEDLLALDPASA